jgi:hypothetical protein
MKISILKSIFTPLVFTALTLSSVSTFAGAAFGLYSTSKTVERILNRDPNAQMNVPEVGEIKQS